MKASTLISMILACSLMSTGQPALEPRVFFREQMGLSDDQITSIAHGRPAEIIVFGAVFVKATPEQYVKIAFDMGRLRQLHGYLGVGRFGDPPMLSDLEGLALEPDDIRNFKILQARQVRRATAG